jgi:hypothetical protein
MSQQSNDAGIRPELTSPAHVDQGSGHFDFPKHADLHLDVKTPQVTAPIETMLQTREAINEWVRLVNDRIMALERQVMALEGRIASMQKPSEQ